MVSEGRIAHVLPSRETFTLRKSGALALCARDWTRFSRYAGRIDVFGVGPCEYADVPYRELKNWRRWWRRNRDAYADAVAAAVDGVEQQRALRQYQDERRAHYLNAGLVPPAPQ